MPAKEDITSASPTRDQFNLRLVVIFPVIFILASLSVGLLAITLTQLFLNPPIPDSRSLLFLYLWVVGMSLFTGLLGIFVAYSITKPVRKALLEAQRMIRFVESDPPPTKAANEVEALSTRSNLQLNLKPRPMKREERMSRFEVELDVEGSQSNLLAFLDALLSMPKLITIERLRISSVPGKENTLRANLVIQKITLLHYSRYPLERLSE